MGSRKARQRQKARKNKTNESESFKIDIFGDTDPRKMPGHFFFSASAVHYETAIEANVAKQNYSVCPRHWYIDAEFTCERCGREFTWAAIEQRAWFEEFFFWVDSRPRHCRECRGELRQLAELRKEYDATVSDARNKGTDDQKKRIVEIVSKLERALGQLPENMVITKELFQRQAENPKRRGD